MLKKICNYRLVCFVILLLLSINTYHYGEWFWCITFSIGTIISLILIILGLLCSDRNTSGDLTVMK